MADEEVRFEYIYQTMHEKEEKQTKKLLDEPTVEMVYCYSIFNCLFNCCFLYE
jgi:hypothetical protein